MIFTEVFNNDSNENDNDLLKLNETISNPLFGFIANNSGLFHNIRFFSPYIKPNNIKNIRNFVADKSDESITSILIKLFPSPAGQLSVSTTAISNPLNLFKGNIKESIKFFASLFIAILKDEKFFQFNFNQGKIEIKTNFEKRKDLFKKLIKLFLAQNLDSIFRGKTMKLLLIHSYLINALEPTVLKDTEGYFKLYLSEIANSYKSSADSKFFEIKIDKEILQLSVDYFNNSNSKSFPYSLVNKPESNKSIPSYIRSLNKFDEDEKFSDCADIALLQLCNCLFFYEGKYSLDHLPKPSEDLKNFYQNHREIFILTLEIRNEWSKVIQDLEKPKENNSKYPTDYILYKKSTNNEVKTGIINMMNVLIKITGLQDEKILDGIEIYNLEERLAFLIDKLSIKEKSNSGVEESVAKLELYRTSLNECETGINNKKDFSGTFNIKFKYKNKTIETIKVCHYNNLKHVELVFVEKENSGFDIGNKNEILEKLEIPNYQNLLIKSFLFPEDRNIGWNFENYVDKIFLSGKIDSNILSLNILEKICDFITELENSEKIENLEKIMSLILDKVELSDFGTKKMFSKFLCLKRTSLHKNEARLALSGYSKSFEEKTTFLVKKWEEFFNKEIPEFDNLNINHILMYSEYSRSSEIKLKKFLIENLSNFVNIERLDLNNLDLNEREIANIISKLKNPEKFKELFCKDNQLLSVPEEIVNLSSLKDIDFSRCKIDKLSDSFSNLKLLEVINLSENYLKNVSPNFFRNFKKLEKLNLRQTFISADFLEQLFESINPKELDISENTINFLPKNIRNLTNLKHLNIKNTQILDLPFELKELTNLEELILSVNNLKNISPENFPNLRKLDLRETYISADFLEKLFESINPEELDISENTINFLPKNIRNLTNLKHLNIKNTQILDLPFELKKLKALKKIYLEEKNFSDKTKKTFQRIL